MPPGSPRVARRRARPRPPPPASPPCLLAEREPDATRQRGSSARACSSGPCADRARARAAAGRRARRSARSARSRAAPRRRGARTRAAPRSGSRRCSGCTDSASHRGRSRGRTARRPRAGTPHAGRGSRAAARAVAHLAAATTALGEQHARSKSGPCGSSQRRRVTPTACGPGLRSATALSTPPLIATATRRIVAAPSTPARSHSRARPRAASRPRRQPPRAASGRAGRARARTRPRRRSARRSTRSRTAAQSSPRAESPKLEHRPSVAPQSEGSRSPPHHALTPPQSTPV